MTSKMKAYKKKTKTSIKLLIGTAFALLLLVVLGFSSYRIDYDNNLKTKKETIKEMALEPFSELNINENWDVDVKQGTEYKLEYPIEFDRNVKESVNQNNQIITIGKNSFNNSSKVKIEITTLKLNKVNIRKASEIRINTFKSDTMTIGLEKGAIFNGDKNTFNNVTFSVLESY